MHDSVLKSVPRKMAYGHLVPPTVKKKMELIYSYIDSKGALAIIFSKMYLVLNIKKKIIAMLDLLC